MTSTSEALAGTAVIVTGATSGLGRAVALRLAAASANVALLGRSQGDLDNVCDQFEAMGVRALPIQADLAHAASLGKIVDRAVREFGELSVLSMPRVRMCRGHRARDGVGRRRNRCRERTHPRRSKLTPGTPGRPPMSATS